MRFDSYHPMINLIYFTAAIFCAVQFQHPVFLAISYLAAFAYSVKLNGRRSLVLNLCLLPLAAAYAGYYSYYNHFGVTNLRMNFIGNQITLEAVAAGCVRGVTAATVVMIVSCVFAVVSTDKVVYLFGRVSPRASLFLAVLLRFLPRVGQRAARIGLARRGIGRGCFQGSLIQRIRHMASFVSILVTWTLEDLIESAASMKCRGCSLRGRTAFSIYRFDNRDRGFVLVVFLCLTVTAAAAALDQTRISYNPQIVMNRVTAWSYVFYAAYALFLLLPLLSQAAGEWRFRKGQKD